MPENSWYLENFVQFCYLLNELMLSLSMPFSQTKLSKVFLVCWWSVGCTANAAMHSPDAIPVMCTKLFSIVMPLLWSVLN